MPMHKNTTTIIAALPTLSRADLAAVRGAADGLLGPTAAANQGTATPLWVAVKRALGLDMPGPGAPGTRTYKQFKRGEQAVECFVAKHFTDVQDQVSRQALLALIVDCLIDSLRMRGLPLNLLTVTMRLEDAPQALLDAFPGYIESGLGHVILNHMTRGKNGFHPKADGPVAADAEEQPRKAAP